MTSVLIDTTSYYSNNNSDNVPPGRHLGRAFFVLLSAHWLLLAGPARTCLGVGPSYSARDASTVGRNAAHSGRGGDG